MKKTVFLNFRANALAVHSSHSVAGKDVKDRLLEAEDYTTVAVTYCSGTLYKYTVCFLVTETYIIVHNAPLTVYLDKSALNRADCQSHLYNIVRAALEV